MQKSSRRLEFREQGQGWIPAFPETATKFLALHGKPVGPACSGVTDASGSGLKLAQTSGHHHPIATFADRLPTSPFRGHLTKGLRWLTSPPRLRHARSRWGVRSFVAWSFFIPSYLIYKLKLPCPRPTLRHKCSLLITTMKANRRCIGAKPFLGALILVAQTAQARGRGTFGSGD